MGRIEHRDVFPELLCFHKALSFLFLQCETVLALQGVFSEGGSTLTSVSFDIELTILPSFLVLANIFLACWALCHRHPFLLVFLGGNFILWWCGLKVRESGALESCR